MSLKLIASFCAGLLAASLASADTPTIGSETKLPIPRYVSIKASEANARRGPSLTHKVDWVFQRKDLPVRVTGEYGHWRRIQDMDGAGGWVHYSLLSGVRTVVVQEDLLAVHAHPDPSAQVRARLERGVVARLGKCDPTWCRVTTAGYRGWVPRAALWGIGADEIRD